MADAPVILNIKAVPGARRSEIAGMLAGRLKIRIAAPPEDGRANKAVCELLAKALDLRPRQVRITAGHASAEKTVAIDGITPEDLRRFLAAV